MRDILAPGRKPSNIIGVVFRFSSSPLFFFASGLRRARLVHGISLTRATAISVPTFVLLRRTWTMQSVSLMVWKDERWIGWNF